MEELYRPKFGKNSRRKQSVLWEKKKLNLYVRQGRLYDAA